MFVDFVCGVGEICKFSICAFGAREVVADTVYPLLGLKNCCVEQFMVDVEWLLYDA